MEKRYQIFVSSTYADLKDERQNVIQTLIEMDCIPAGMELFPAADEDQFEFIKRIIDDCDYYLVIVGGRYGSLTQDGISYTEKEYDYAIQKGIKVIALIHEDPENIPLGKSEKDPALRKKLEDFKNKLSTGRLVKHWNKAEELPGLVSLSVSKTIKTYPAIGWVRANIIANEQVLTEVNELRKKNDGLEEKIQNIQKSEQTIFENIAGLEETFIAKGEHYIKRGSYTSKQPWQAPLTWETIFLAIAPYLMQPHIDSAVKAKLSDELYRLSGNKEPNHNLDDQDFQTIKIQLKALGFVQIRYTATTGGGMGLFWNLTPLGEKIMLEKRTIKTLRMTS